MAITHQGVGLLNRHKVYFHEKSIAGFNYTDIIISCDTSDIWDGELQKLSFNPFEPNNTFTLHCDGNYLVDSITFVIIATRDHKTSQGYGKFLNLVEQALRATAEKLDYNNSKEELVIRLHQHLGYNL